MPEPERTALYRLYDAEGRLLYIGITDNPRRRWVQHAAKQADAWWPDVARKSIEWFPSRGAAEAAEVRAIEREGPPYNSRHVVNWPNPPEGLKRRTRAPSERVAEHNFRLFMRGVDFQRESANANLSVPEMVALKLRCDIASGLYPVGTRLPIGHDLCARFGISSTTLSRGIALLKSQGLLRVHPGRGTFVIATP